MSASTRCQGHDLVLRLNTESHQQRIEALDKHIKQFPVYLGWTAATAACRRELLLRAFSG
ncbi:cyclic di-GMP phosphodiesterase [Salmonella enterica subsp. enterica]|uniref:Cyclic di-GMP phosphodiesterase n=1 Tax=Salmonella enterica I TaxID=59201 RepID=A0A447N6G0_SALET|nr:cyclic di-GMP phosphodiesterase [Salmonella enterica subsp. enterica]